MNLLARSTRAVGVLAAAALGITVLTVAPTAGAAEIGSLSFTALTTQDSAFSVTTSDACPDPATNFQVKVAGGNVPVDAGNIVGNTAGSTIATGIRNGAFTVPVSNTLRVFATNNGLTQLADGTYTVTLICRALLASASLGDFTGTFTVSGGGATVTPVVPVVKADTAVAFSVAATSGWGQQLSLAATVSNTTDPSGPKPTGTVAFTEGATVLASATVNASGVATTTYGLLGLGDHTVKAVYTPSGGAAFNGSTSADDTVTISLAAPTLLSAPSLSGSVKVGGRVVCNPGIWSGATQYTYEFLKNGVVAQTSTTDADVVLAAADLGKTLACRVTGANPVGAGTPATTTGVKIGTGSAAIAAVKPRIVFSGSAANVGETLTASRGTWSPSASYSFTYVWKRGTTIVKQGTTATTYKATAVDKGKKLTLTVQAKRTGYATGSATSVAVVVK